VSAGRAWAAGVGARALERPAVTLMVVYAASRLLVLATMQAAAMWAQTPAGVGHLEPGLGDILRLWDSVWYQRIAEDGYPLPLPADPETGRLTYSAWAFYPAFPMVVRAVMATGLPFVPAAVGLNLVLGGVAVLLVWRLFGFALHATPQPARDRLALVGAALWCLHPATPILSMPYTEALASVLVAAALLLLMQRRYLAVAVLALALGLTRAVAPALACAALAHLVLRWREDRAAGTVPLRGHRVSAAVMLAATALSAVAWPLAVGVLTGLPRAFLDVQAAWGQRPDRGPFVLWAVWAWEARGLFGLLVLVGLLAAYTGLVLGRHGRWLAVEVRAWALAYPLYLFAVVRPITSMWRFLLLDFPVMALVASVALRTSTGSAVVRHWRRRAAVVALVLAAGVLWFTATLLTYTPWGARPP
jgi:hypothetical protein